jgi:uncharacterized protein (TIGR00369 family)
LKEWGEEKNRMRHTARNKDFEAAVRASFERQELMKTISARLTLVRPGEIEIEMPYRMKLTQQHGFIHAGILTAVMDSACGYAALSLMPEKTEVLTVEYKVNFLSPGAGERFKAKGRVLKAGATISVCAGEVVSPQKRGEVVVATMLATMISHPGQPLRRNKKSSGNAG